LQEDLAVREEWSKKGRWKQPEKLESILRPNQSTWAFDRAASGCSVSNSLEPPWIELHAVSFLVQASQLVPRSQIAIVHFPRSKLPAALVSDDSGEHLIASLELLEGDLIRSDLRAIAEDLVRLAE